MQKQPCRAAHPACDRLKLPSLDVEAAALGVQLPGSCVAARYVDVQVCHASRPGMVRRTVNQRRGNPL